MSVQVNVDGMEMPNAQHHRNFAPDDQMRLLMN